jgi:predicted HicB family RNase H-like nuclease
VNIHREIDMATSELTYKGFTGSIEVSIEDGCLHGRILFINDIVSYEGNTVEEIKVEFERAADRYIEYCAKTGKQANKPYSGTFNIRIGENRHRALALLANQKKVSINEAICSAIDLQQRIPRRQTVQTISALDSIIAETYKIQNDAPLAAVESESATTVKRFNLEPDSITQGTC